MTASDLTADLPAPRDDEPASLRNDIADELRDHLECALRREELKTPSEPWGSAPRSEAQMGVAGVERSSPPASAETAAEYGTSRSSYERVLERFGNPRAVARKLWLDAMRKKIMGQRVSIMLQAIMAGAVIAMCVLIWQSTREQSRSHTALVAELLKSQHDANAALIDRLAALGNGGHHREETPQWLPFSFRLVDEQSNPVAGDVVLIAEEGPAGKFNQRARTDAEGIANLGPIPPGGYRWEVTVAATGETASDTVLVGPGRAERFEVICPTEPPPPVELTFSVESPQNLSDVAIYHLLEIDFRSRQFANRRWNAPLKDQRWLIADATGKILGEMPQNIVKETKFVSRRGTQTDYARSIAGFDPQPLRPLPGYQLDVGGIVYVGRPHEGEETVVPPLVGGLQIPQKLVVEELPGAPTTVSIGAEDSYWFGASRALASIQPPQTPRSNHPGSGRGFTRPLADPSPSSPDRE